MVFVSYMDFSISTTARHLIFLKHSDCRSDCIFTARYKILARNEKFIRTDVLFFFFFLSLIRFTGNAECEQEMILIKEKADRDR